MTRFLILALLLTIAPVFAETPQNLVENRCCYPVVRNLDGSIYRDPAVTRAFRKIWPCPSTRLLTGPCPGWAIQHLYPLACGGADSVNNLYWLPVVLKSGAGRYPVDRWERKVYCDATPIQMPLGGLLGVTP